MMQLKVCGITRKEDLDKLVELGVHYAGFIFYEKSPRFVGNKLDARTVRETKGILKVGVFVNAPLEQVKQLIGSYGLHLVQLHGDEDPAYCAALQALVPVIRAFRIGEDVNWDILAAYVPVTNYFLFDTAAGKAYGGTGKLFNWELLHTYPFDHPFFLSGGIGPEQLEDLLAFEHPALFAADVNSKFETAPGVKDMVSVQQFSTKIL
ncbi:phosphoribosylanthranilate isomerase [Chitinophaga sp. LS1]|uniref:phosphoribosylanthranilate isomerase n=1 Tax=Chitinophaga sp. LS1 TaxID=3051176 RepID=UPI002AAC2291|nr:phosphoribosylanthranilate isomerase [Chitinophaga sp. LS1]WPV69760.1 phosphoribosylanthranilate isomerase [Chitinophaga sp. LS1]